MAIDTTPLMKQYFFIKEKYKDEVLFFRLGDFYEMFDTDAQEISRLLNLTLTHRGSYPMCGIPFHAARNYIKRLLAFGKKIAICEQMELSDKPNQIARREVIQVITPATVVEQEFLESSSYNYLLAVFNDSCAYCDISTGDLRMCHLDKDDIIASLLMIFEQIRPKEVLVCDDEYFLKPDFRQALDSQNFLTDKLPASYFSVEGGWKLLCQIADTLNLEGFGISRKEKLLGPAGALMRYIQETAKPSSTKYFDFSIVSNNEFLQIDESTRRNLELFENNQDRSRRFSLFESIDMTRTSAGKRQLESWLSFPLNRVEDIVFRQDWIRWLCSDKNELERMRKELDSSLDVQRLANRIALHRAIPRDILGLKQTLGCFFRLISSFTDRYVSLLPDSVTPNELASLNDLMLRIDEAVNEDCTGPFVSGSVIKDGFDEELDTNRSLVAHSDQMFQQYLQSLKDETGITTMKIVNSRVAGYVIEVSKSQIPKVPSTFFRRQTLVNSERYTTDRLSELEIKNVQAEQCAEAREREIYEALLEQCALHNDVLNQIGRFLSTVDCFQSLASKALSSSYCCPSLVEDDVLNIVEGRHPVVEKYIPPESFVPNDTIMEKRFFLITGPNMAGKSTYLRQTALIVLLAHIGSFVPASSAVIGITDKIFCRVGASDNLARGESTFLVEMQEAAFILQTCTRRSLVIMDEIGRGTSTQEGMSIAHAIIRYLLKIDCKTLFATHFHELGMMDTFGMALFTLAVKESPSSIKFLRKLIPGVASSSYALHVARMAGIPTEVVRNAASFQQKHFEDYGIDEPNLFTDNTPLDQIEEKEETRLKAIKAKEIVDEINDFDIDNSTPFQALIELQKIKEKAKCY